MVFTKYTVFNKTNKEEIIFYQGLKRCESVLSLFYLLIWVEVKQRMSLYNWFKKINKNA